MKSTNLTGKNHNRILSLPTRFESRIRKIPRHAFIKRYTFLLNRKRKTEEEEKSKKEKENFHFENVIIERIHGSKGRIGERVVGGQEPGQSNYCATRRLTSFFFSSLSLSESGPLAALWFRGVVSQQVYIITLEYSWPETASALTGAPGVTANDRAPGIFSSQGSLSFPSPPGIPISRINRHDNLIMILLTM